MFVLKLRLPPTHFRLLVLGRTGRVPAEERRYSDDQNRHPDRRNYPLALGDEITKSAATKDDTHNVAVEPQSRPHARMMPDREPLRRADRQIWRAYVQCRGAVPGSGSCGEECPDPWNPFEIVRADFVELDARAENEVSNSRGDEDLAWRRERP